MAGKGDALSEEGRYGDALKSCGRAIEIKPRGTKARFNQGLVLCLLDRYAEARGAFEEAQRLGHPLASQVLEKMRQLKLGY